MRILQCSHDEAVQFTRKMLLEQTFPQAYVMSVFAIPTLQAACAANNFELVILGQSLSDREKLDGEASVRKSCKNAKIVEMYHHYPATKADLAWNATDPASNFATALIALMGGPKQPKATP
jgi:hypothetical protein